MVNRNVYFSNMTTSEVFKLIISEHKWYAPYMSAQAAFLFKKRFVKGELKHSTIERMFEKFGFEQNEVTWKRK